MNNQDADDSPHSRRQYIVITSQTAVCFNSLAPEKYDNDFQNIISENRLRFELITNSYEIALRGIP